MRSIAFMRCPGDALAQARVLAIGFHQLSTDVVDVRVFRRGEGGEVELLPGVLVAADDDAGGVGVGEEDGGRGSGVPEEVIFKREVEVGIVRGGTVDVKFPRRIAEELEGRFGGSRRA